MKLAIRTLAFLLACCSLLISGCGSNATAHFPQNVSIAMSPKITSLPVNATQQFTATVTNYTSTPYWLVESNNSPQGTITSSGLYTAPSVPPINNYGGFPGNQGIATVQARADYPVQNDFFDGVATDSDTFVITAPSITVGFIKDSASVPLGGTFKFQPYAVGAIDRTYTLQANGVTGGSFAAGSIVQDAMNAGLYTAPTAMPMTGPTVTITVISNADPTKTATATVTLH
jgi:hypothetical protein